MGKIHLPEFSLKANLTFCRTSLLWCEQQRCEREISTAAYPQVSFSQSASSEAHTDPLCHQGL